MNADAMSRRPEQQDYLQIREEVTECSGEQSSPPPKPSNQDEATKTPGSCVSYYGRNKVIKCRSMS